jgi:tetratricopeptide (TPR) repeat protein
LETGARKLIDLQEVRADGWFEELGEDLADFDQLCQAMGRRFVAFSMIAGVRVSSVNYDTHSPHTSLVEFTIGDTDEPQHMALGELRERLGTALLATDELHPDLDDDPSPEDIRRFIGRRYLLLAPVFGLGLEAIEVGGDDEPMLKLRLGSGVESISVQGLRDVIHNAIRSEVARSRPSQAFSIDFKKVPQAEASNERGDYDETIALLGAWPGPLSMFLRTPQGQTLGDSERSKLVRALCALGEAYLRKRQADWSEDVLRLGIQFGQELDASAPLFGLLGRARVETGRYGEAIGLLRRALSLGADPREHLPLLARCFVERERYVAALGCIDEALEAGVDPESIRELQTEVAEALGPAYERYQTLMHG